MTTATVPKARPGSLRRRRLATRALIYFVLSSVAALMLFPFIYMFFTSLKDANDVFTYPPRVLPYEASTVSFDGEQLPAYQVEVDGDVRTLALVEDGIRAGVFVPVSDPGSEPVAVPLDRAEPTGATAVIDGEEVEVFLVAADGGTVEAAKLRDTSVGRFVDPDDRSVEGFAVVRTADPAETLVFRWGNYGDVLDIRNFDRALTNTILVTILVVAGQIFTSVMGGYAFSRIRFPGRDRLFVAYLGSIMIPFVVLIIPLFQIVVQLGWNNHLGSLVWPFVYTAYGTFLMRQFFLSIPKDLEEAAYIDGASRWRILWGIFVPLSWPAIATLATFSFLYAWNSFIWPLVAIDAGNTEDHVLTLALQILGGQGADAPQLIFAGVTLAMVVPMVVFVLAQRYFVENVATSGIK